MIGRKSVIGLAVLCALVFSAIAATSAFAAPGRAYTCTESAAVKEFTDAHCTTKGSPATRGHTLITEANTKITLTNEKTLEGTTASSTAKLKGKLAGVATEVQCTKVHGTGTMTNEATFVTGGGEIVYTGCSVTLPAGRNCKVTGETVKTKPLVGTTSGLPNNNELKFEMGAGETKFAEVPIENCTNNSPPTANYPVTGSLIATTSGATTSTTHEQITTQGTLKFGGNPAGLDGKVTISMEGGDPIVLT